MRRALAPLIAVCLLAPTLGACGSGDDESPDATDATTTITTATATAAVDPSLPVAFADVEAATADLPPDGACAVWAWGTNSTGADGALDFRQLDCYPDEDAVSAGIPTRVQTIVWVQMPSADDAARYAASDAAGGDVLLAGPTAVVFDPLWSARVDEIAGEIQRACGCGVRQG